MGQTKPRYSVIEDALRAEIASGTQSVGTCLPTEHELCTRFAASRFTVRQALTGLRAAGMIEPRPGIGTLVIASEPKATLVQTLHSVDELLQYPGPMLREGQRHAHVTADAALADFLGGDPGDEWLWVEAVRRPADDGLPLCWMEAWLPPRLLRAAEIGATDGTPLLLILEREFGLRADHAQIQMTAGRVTQTMAAPLMADEGSPAFVITRRYRDANGEVFLITRLVHPEGRFSLNFEFQTT